MGNFGVGNKISSNVFDILMIDWYVAILSEQWVTVFKCYISELFSHQS